MEREPPGAATRRALSFVDGLGAGVTACALAVLVYLGAHADALVGMYRDLGGPLPPLTRLVLHPAWTIGVPVTIALLAGGAVVVRSRPRHALIALAVLALLGVALSYVGAYQPIWALAGNIQ